MPAPSEELARIVAGVVKEHGCQLYRLNLVGDSRLEVYIDKKGGATLGECERISRALSAKLGTAGDNWRLLSLDVSTPGIERMLYEPEHFRAAVGERILVKTGQEALEGRLTEADNQGIVIETTPGQGRRFKYNELLSAQVKKTTEELFKRR